MTISYKKLYKKYYKTINDNNNFTYCFIKCKQCNYCNNCMCCKLLEQIMLITDYLEVRGENPELFTINISNKEVIGMKLQLKSKIINQYLTSDNYNFIDMDNITSYLTYEKYFQNLIHDCSEIFKNITNENDAFLYHEIAKLFRLVLKTKSYLYALVVVDDIEQNNVNEDINKNIIDNILFSLYDNYDLILDLVNNPKKYIHFITLILYNNLLYDGL